MATRRAPRADWLWLHRWIGLVSALFLGWAALTGCLLCFERPIDAALNADLFKAPAVARPIDVAIAVDRFQAAHRELRVRSFPLAVPPDRRIPVKVEAADKARPLGYDQVFLDRASGAEVGRRSDKAALTARGGAELLHDIHYTLLAGKPGRWFMGVMAFGWLASNFVGAWLTWPLRRPYWRQWRRMWRFRRASALPRLLLDLHRSSGLWLLPLLTALAFTSVALNFFEFYQPAMGRIVAPVPSVFDAKPPFPEGVDGKLGFVRAVDRLRAEVAGQPGAWQPATALYFPNRRLYAVTSTDDGRLNYRRLGPVYTYVDGVDGRLVEIDSPYGANRGEAMIRMLYPLHSGRVAGWPGVAVVFVLGLATLKQCGTGVYVWWRKRRSRRAPLTS